MNEISALNMSFDELLQYYKEGYKLKEGCLLVKEQGYTKPLMFLDIKSGSMDIIASGTIINFKRQPIEIIIPSPDRDMKLIFEFNDTTGNIIPQTEKNLIDTKSLHIIFYNFKSPLGTGNSEPVYLGTVAGRELYLNYRIYHLEGSDKTLQYTFYLGKKVE